MANGRSSDDLLTDITLYKIPTFSSNADRLIAEIVWLGGKSELERQFDLFAPPPLHIFEATLQVLRDRLDREAKERGWDV